MKIIVTDCDHASMDQENAVFEKEGLTYELVQCRTEDDLIATCRGYQIAINQYAPFTRKVLQALAPELKQIVRYGVGVNNVDLIAATELGVQVCNVPDYGMNEVADQAASMLLALWRKVCLMDRCTKGEKWDYTRAIPIHRIPGRTVGIYGLGRIGRTFARRMKGFDVELIACDPKLGLGGEVDGVKIVSFDTLLEKSDAISIHSPLNEETRGKFDLAAFEKMKSDAVLVNTARGGIVSEADLYTALSTGMIGAAGLDVVVQEPMRPGSPLFELENYICTPHIAWYSEEAARELKQKVAEEAARFAKGEKVCYPVNRL
ncbi:MAG: C-terminal binding protein [Lawsonibacter sp.]